MVKESTTEAIEDDSEGTGTDDSDTEDNNPQPSDSAIDDDTAAADNITAAAAVGAASAKKRKTIDESTLSAEDLQKLEVRRAYNRHCAAKGKIADNRWLALHS
jgi:hypothetical protein